MQTSLIRTISGWRFEVPLALVLAASGLFMVAAIPPERLTVFPGLIAIPAAQIVLGALFGAVLGVAGFVAMRWPWPVAAAAAAAPQDADETIEDAPQEDGPLAAAEVSLRLRRADRHPDAPARAPIIASRDLGSPFMEAGAYAQPPEPAADEIPEGDFAEIAHQASDAADAPSEPAAEPAAAAEAEPIAVEPEPEPEPVVAAPIVAFAPTDDPVPPIARTQRASLAAMMERLSAGLERRAGEPELSSAAPRPRDRQPALRDALDELNRLAARRG